VCALASALPCIRPIAVALASPATVNVAIHHIAAPYFLVCFFPIISMLFEAHAALFAMFFEVIESLEYFCAQTLKQHFGRLQ
jgi:hypothetical protein